MQKTCLAALLMLPMSIGVVSAETVAPGAAALSPYTATRLGHKPRNIRKVHCEKKADSIGVQGKARGIYLHKCTRG